MRLRVGIFVALAVIGVAGLGAENAAAQVSCSGVPAFQSCTAYASGAKVTYNGSLYHSIAPISSTRDCPPNSPYNPSNDNWWVNDGTCSGGATATPTATKTPTATATSGSGSTATATKTPTATATSGSTGGIANGTYTVVNKNSNKCVDAAAAGTANGTVVQQYTCNGTGAQNWVFTATDSGYYKVLTQNNTGQGWDVTGGTSATADGTKIQLWGNGGATNQQFQAVSEGSGYYHFVARNSGKCVDINGASTADSVQLQIWSCNGSAAQSFKVGGSSATPTPTATSGSGGGGAIRFAPYIDMSLGGATSIQNQVSAGGWKAVTLAFLVDSGGCTPAWGGVGSVANDSNILNTVNGLKNAGVSVVISEGGYNAFTLAQGCSSVSALVSAYQSVINKYHPARLDFDVESGAATDQASIDRRNKAIKQLTGVSISYTLPVGTGGLTSDGMYLVNNAHSNGVNPTVVNVMTMDFGSCCDNGGNMLLSSEQAANATKGQISNAGLTSAVGITPMIGVNDTTTEIFSLQNGRDLVSWSKSNGIGMLAFWSLGRDNGGCAGAGSAQATCSGVSQNTWDFSHIFEGF